MSEKFEKLKSDLLLKRNLRRKCAGFLAALMTVTVLSVAQKLTHDASAINTDVFCGVEEHAHAMEQGCYNEERLLICTESETAHVHEDSCYELQNVLTCTLEEGEEHSHDETCMESVRNLHCGLSETAHVHAEDCYRSSLSLICAKEEHTHSEECHVDPDHKQETQAEDESEEESSEDDADPDGRKETVFAGQFILSEEPALLSEVFEELEIAYTKEDVVSVRAWDDRLRIETGEEEIVILMQDGFEDSAKFEVLFTDGTCLLFEAVSMETARGQIQDDPTPLVLRQSWHISKVMDTNTFTSDQIAKNRYSILYGTVEEDGTLTCVATDIAIVSDGWQRNGQSTVVEHKQFILERADETTSTAVFEVTDADGTRTVEKTAEYVDVNLVRSDGTLMSTERIYGFFMPVRMDGTGFNVKVINKASFQLKIKKDWNDNYSNIRPQDFDSTATFILKDEKNNVPVRNVQYSVFDDGDTLVRVESTDHEGHFILKENESALFALDPAGRYSFEELQGQYGGSVDCIRDTGPVGFYSAHDGYFRVQPFDGTVGLASVTVTNHLPQPLKVIKQVVGSTPAEKMNLSYRMRVVDKDGNGIGNQRFERHTGSSVTIEYTDAQGWFSLKEDEEAWFFLPSSLDGYRVLEEQNKDLYTTQIKEEEFGHSKMISLDPEPAKFKDGSESDVFSVSNAMSEIVTFKNTLRMDLSVSKTAEGDALDNDAEYAFILNRKNNGTQPLNSTAFVVKDATGNKIREGVTNADGTFKLKNGETAVFNLSRDCMDWSLTESDARHAVRTEIVLNGQKISDSTSGDFRVTEDLLKDGVRLDVKNHMGSVVMVRKDLGGPANSIPLGQSYTFKLLVDGKEMPGIFYSILDAKTKKVVRTDKTDASSNFTMTDGETAQFALDPDLDIEVIEVDTKGCEGAKITVNGAVINDIKTTGTVDVVDGTDTDIHFTNYKTMGSGSYRVRLYKNVADPRPANVKDLEFRFRLHGTIPDDTGNLPYEVRDQKTDALVRTGVTEADGSFTLKDGEYAEFALDGDKKYHFEETDNQGMAAIKVRTGTSTSWGKDSGTLVGSNLGSGDVYYTNYAVNRELKIEKTSTVTNYGVFLMEVKIVDENGAPYMPELVDIRPSYNGGALADPVELDTANHRVLIRMRIGESYSIQGLKPSYKATVTELDVDTALYQPSMSLDGKIYTPGNSVTAQFQDKDAYVQVKNTYAAQNEYRVTKIAVNNTDPNAEFDFQTKVYRIDSAGDKNPLDPDYLDFTFLDENGDEIFKPYGIGSWNGSISYRLKDSETFVLKLPDGVYADTQEGWVDGAQKSWQIDNGPVHNGDQSDPVKMDGKNVLVTFTNAYSSVRIRKDCIGGTPGDRFKMVAVITDPNGYAYRYRNAPNQEYDVVELVDARGYRFEIRFELGHGEEMLLDGFPIGSHVQVEEVDSGNYTPVYSYDGKPYTAYDRVLLTQAHSMQINNVSNSTKLQLKKVVDGPDDGREYLFDLVLTDPTNQNIYAPILSDLSLNTTDSTRTAANTAVIGTDGKIVVSLKHEESIVVSNIPQGYTAAITERNHPDHDVKIEHGTTVIDADTATLALTGAQTDVTVTNTPKNKSLKIQKAVTGGASKEQFEFEIAVTANGKPVTLKPSTGLTIDPTDPSKAKFKLADGDVIEIKDLPLGAEVRVQELVDDDAVVHVFDTSSGKVKISDEKTATVTMSKDQSILYENNMGVVLPETGGTGTMPMRIAGAAWTGLALLYACLRKRAERGIR